MDMVMNTNDQGQLPSQTHSLISKPRSELVNLQLSNRESKKTIISEPGFGGYIVCEVVPDVTWLVESARMVEALEYTIFLNKIFLIKPQTFWQSSLLLHEYSNFQCLGESEKLRSVCLQIFR